MLTLQSSTKTYRNDWHIMPFMPEIVRNVASKVSRINVNFTKQHYFVLNYSETYTLAYIIISKSLVKSCDCEQIETYRNRRRADKEATTSFHLTTEPGLAACTLETQTLPWKDPATNTWIIQLQHFTVNSCIKSGAAAWTDVCSS